MRPRRLRWLLWILVPVSIIALLWLWLRSPVPEPDPATTELLESAAERWWRPDGQPGDIPEADWPVELKLLDPEAVYVCPEGVYIRFGSFFVESWGLFVLPKGSVFQPERHGDPSFQLLQSRVYRYEIKG